MIAYAALTTFLTLIQDVVAQVPAPTHQSIVTLDYGIIVILLVQTAALFRWGGKISQKVDSHEKRLWVIESVGSPPVGRLGVALDREADTVEDALKKIDSITEKVNSNSVRLARIETLLNVMHTDHTGKFPTVHVEPKDD